MTNTNKTTDSTNADIKYLIKEGNQHLREGEYRAAVFCYDRALELDEKNSWIWDNRGVALSKAKRYTDAIESFEIALDLKPDNVKAWSNMGVALGALRRYEESLNSFEHALEIDPENTEAWNNKGTALFNLQLFSEALEAFNKVIEINQDHALAWAGKDQHTDSWMSMKKRCRVWKNTLISVLENTHHRLKRPGS